MAVLLLQMFICIVSNMVTLRLQNHGTLASQTKFCGTLGKSSLKPIKPEKNGVPIYIYVCVCVCVWLFVYIHTHIYLYVCVCVLYVHILYIYIYINVTVLFLLPIVGVRISIIILSLSNRATLKNTDKTKWKRMGECYVNVTPINS